MARVMPSWHAYSILQQMIFITIVCIVIAWLMGDVVILVLGVGTWFVLKYIFNKLICKNHVYNSLQLLSLVKTLKSTIALINGRAHLVKDYSKLYNETSPEIEAGKMIELIIKDFVETWLNLVTNKDTDIKENIKSILQIIAHNIFDKIATIDKYKTLERLVEVYRGHLSDLQEARHKYKKQPTFRKRLGEGKVEVKKIKDISSAYHMLGHHHPTLKNNALEQEYLTGIVECIITEVVPIEHTQTTPARVIVVNLLAKNVVKSLLDLMQEPHWLYKALILILSEDEPEEDSGNVPSEGADDMLGNKGVNDSVIIDESDQAAITEDLPSPSFFLTDSYEGDDDIDKKGGNHSQYVTSPDVISPQTNPEGSSCGTASLGSIDASIPQHRDADSVSFKDCHDDDPQTQFLSPGADWSSSQDEDSFGDPIISENKTITSIPGELTSGGMKQIPILVPKSRVNSSGDVTASEAYGQLEGSIHEAPRFLFEEITISTAELAKEPGSSGVYTLYSIQVIAWYKTQFESWVLQKVFVKRRFREFVTLHERLEEHSKYSKLMKGIKGPSRWGSFPFGNLREDHVEKRRLFLNEYLKTLITLEEVGNSLAVRDFLAYEGDANIAYVRRSNEGPKIEQVLIKTMSGVFQRLKRSLEPSVESPGASSIPVDDNQDAMIPAEPQEPVSHSENYRISTASPVVQSGGSEIERCLDACCHEGTSRPTDEMTEHASHIMWDQTEFQDAIEAGFSSGTLLEGHGCDVTDWSPEGSMELLDRILDLVQQSIMDKDTWIQRKAAVTSLKLLLGRALQTWLCEEVDDVTTMSRCCHYLRLLGEAVWPDGHLDQATTPNPTPSQVEEIQQQANTCLSQFFPVYFPWLFGVETFHAGVTEVIDSLQYADINRSLLLKLLDEIIVILLPDIKACKMMCEEDPHFF